MQVCSYSTVWSDCKAVFWIAATYTASMLMLTKPRIICCSRLQYGNIHVCISGQSLAIVDMFMIMNYKDFLDYANYEKKIVNIGKSDVAQIC